MASDYANKSGTPSVSELFWSFSGMSIQAFGGVLPLAERLVVREKRWLQRKDFVELLALAQALPGPNIVNLSIMVGDKFHGVRGGLSAMAGCLAFPLVLVSLLTIAFQAVSDSEITKGALVGMGSVSIGLVLAMGMRLVSTQGHYKLGFLPMIGTFVAVGFLGLSLPRAILLFGVSSILLRIWLLKAEQKRVVRHDA